MSHAHHEHVEGHDEHDHDHHHEFGPLAELVTLRDWLRYAVTRFNREELFFGHGCGNAYDEAVWLLWRSLHLPLDQLEPFLDAGLMADERTTLSEMIERRVRERIPVAYLLNEAWLGDFHFYVDERVIVPRSFCAELLGEGLEPWIEDAFAVESALDLCTGSGCLAVIMAHCFPAATIVASDISPDALAVAGRNVADYGLEQRIERVESDVFGELGGRRFDLIVANPPYVTSTAIAALPAEFLHEPRMALAAGDDGLDIVRRILTEAHQHLNDGGVMLVEVGHIRPQVEAAFPHLPLVWLTTEESEDMVFLVRAEDLVDLQ